MRLHAALHARAHGVAVEEVGQRVVVHAPGAGAQPRRLEGSRESEAPGIKEQRALGSASAPDWPAQPTKGSGQGGTAPPGGGNYLTELGPVGWYAREARVGDE